MKNITRFILRNTRTGSFVTSAIKVILIGIPMLISLNEDTYFTEAFCKSLLLYLAPLLFDTGQFLYLAEASAQVEKPKDEGMTLLIAMIALLLITLALTALSIVGIFNNQLLFDKFSFILELKVLVYILIASEVIWYTIETFALMVCFLMCKSLSKKQAVIQPVPVSTDSDLTRNL